MKTLLYILITSSLGVAAMGQIDLVTLPASEHTQVTIYNSKDLTLVRDTRRLTLKKGLNTLQFGWENTLIDPTSISLRPLQDADKIDVLVLTYPARVRQIGQWQIISEVQKAVPFEITYFASGLSWRAFYMGTMNEDETAMALKGYVNVSNHSGQDFVNTQTRLIVGQTRLIEEIAYLAQRQYPYGPDFAKDKKGVDHYWYFENRDAKIPLLGDMPLDGRWFATDGDFVRLGVKQIEKTGLSEYFLYTIEGTEDLTNQWTRRLPSFDIDDIPVKSLYKYDEDRYGNQTVRFVSFKNDAEHKLGTTPIPEGTMKIYRAVNAAQNLSYIGGADIKYIPVNEDVELNLGSARLVKVEPILMDAKTDNYTFDAKGNITGSDTIETWQMKLTNTRDIPVDLEITRNFQTDYWNLENNSVGTAHPVYKKHDKNRARFEITLPPQTEQAFSFTVTHYHGARSEVYTKQLQEQTK